jgi:PAS domain S-box-containing protein
MGRDRRRAALEIEPSPARGVPSDESQPLSRDISQSNACAPQSDLPANAAALINSAPVAIYHTDNAGNLTYVNPEYRRIFGLTPDQSANDWAQGVHPDDRARMEASWADFCANPRPMQFGYRTVSGSGAIRYLTERVVRVQGTTGFVGTITDVSELVETKTLLEALIAELPLAVISCDMQGRITHYNREAVKLLSIRVPASGAGTSADYPLDVEAYRPDGVTAVPRVDRPLAKTLRGETVRNMELVCVVPGSAPRNAVSSGRLLLGPDGQPMGAVVVSEDITERKRAELELEHLHEQLRTAARQAGMAEVATSVLHNVGNILTSVNVAATLLAARVRQSKAADLGRVAALLQAQGGKLGQFLASDDRGKLIPKYLELLGEQLVADRTAALEHASALLENVEHIKRTVAMQQSYVKLGGISETVDIVELIEASLRLNATACVRDGVEVRREFAVVPAITVDKHKVLQILVNLVRNAKLACDESGRKDKLLTLRVEKQATGVRILVIDNGVGIAPENMTRLFTHGFTTRKSGHGFGLHSSALAAQELGGSLRAESKGSGCGATFVLELPLTPAEAPRT